MDGYEIPIGADLTGLHEAVAKINASISQMGEQINAALGNSNTALATSENGMRRVAGTATTVSAANNQLAASVTSAAAKMQRAVGTAANLGTALTGLQSGINVASRAAKILTGVNLGTALTGWIAKAGGIRAAFAKIPTALRAIASNPVFKRIAIGAAAAVTAIIAIRTATRVIGAAFRTMGRLASGIFRGMRATAAAAARTIGGAFRGIASLPGKIFGSIPGIGGLLGAAGAVALLAIQLKGASAQAAVFEDLTVSVEHFTGSVSKAKNLLGDLASFAIKTPFETIDVQQTAGGLLGAGIREDVAGITKDLAAMAQNGEQLKELGDAIGKGFAKGKFQTEEVNKFLERGINLVPALQAQLGLTGKAFQKAVEAGLSFETVTAAIRSMSAEGGQFFGLLDRRANTFNGLLSTLSAAWTDLRQAFGAPINDALKPILQAGIDSITSLLEKARELGGKVGDAITIAFVAFKQGKVGELFSAGLSLGVAVAIDALMRGLRGAAAFLAAALPPIFSAAASKLSDPIFWAGVKNIFEGLGQTIAAAIQEGLPSSDQQIIEGRKGLAKKSFDLGGRQIGLAGGVDFGAVLGDSLKLAGAAAAKAAGGDMSPGVAAAKANLKTLTDGFAVAAAKIKAETAAKTALKEGQGTAIAPSPITEGVTGAIKDKLGSLTTSLGAVGGGGFGMSFPGVIAKISQSNTLLKKIAQNTAKSGSSPSLTVLA